MLATNSPTKMTTEPAQPKYQWKVVWKNIILLTIVHIFALQGLHHIFFTAQWKTTLYSYLVACLCGLGITAGAHRLWTHRTYKAKLPLRIFLCLFNTMSLQTPIHIWARDHRVHHKYTDTDADPHNARRGFFFSHMGWLLVKKHPDVTIKGKTVDLSDLEDDPVVMFQKKYYMILAPPLSLLLPALLPWYCWNENLYVSWCVTCMVRYFFSLHSTWSVNSVAHIWGSKPYDKNINPTDNFVVSLCVLGEGWHNYHHVFPWDYRSGELGNYGINWTTTFIDFMAKIGWAYDLKTTSQTMIKSRISRTGEGAKDDGDDWHTIWGWGDGAMKQEDKEFVEILHPKCQ